jgi:plasmid stabilization system protein ParE
MKVRYTDTALGEVDEICSYIARDNPDAASDVADAIEKTVALITERPEAAAVVYADDVRASSETARIRAQPAAPSHPAA